MDKYNRDYKILKSSQTVIGIHATSSINGSCVLLKVI